MSEADKLKLRESLRKVYLDKKTAKHTMTMPPELKLWLQAWADWVDMSVNGLLFHMVTKVLEQRIREWESQSNASEYFLERLEADCDGE